MNRLIFSVLVCALVVAIYLLVLQSVKNTVQPIEIETVQTSSQPPTHHFKHEKFTIDFPTAPHHSSFSEKDPVTGYMHYHEMYVAELPDYSLYMVNTKTYSPSDIQDYEKVFKNFIEEMVASNTRNQLVSATPTQFQDLAAINFIIQNDENMLLNTLFLKENVLYVLTQQTKLNTPDQGKFQQFSASFKFQPQ